MLNTKGIATSFSTGEFEKTYEYIADNAVWEVIEENKFIGKEAILKNTQQVGAYFRSVTTNFQIIHVIQEQNFVAVSGTAEFINDGKRMSFISAFDLYEFDENNMIQKITSYCIQSN